MRKKAILIRNAAATDFGGGERVPVFIAREISRYNIEPLILSGSDKLLSFAKSEHVPFKKTWWWSRQNWSGARALLFPIYFGWQIVLTVYYLGLFKQLKPEVVHIQSKDDFIAATIAAYLLHIDSFWSDYADLKHVWKNHHVWYKNPIGKLVFWAANFTSQIVVVSNEDKKLINSLIPDGRVKGKLTVIYNGTFDDYRSVEENKVFTFISTARLVTDKGIGELIQAFRQLKNEFGSIKLELVGDGPERTEFELLAKDIDGISLIILLVRTCLYFRPITKVLVLHSSRRAWKAQRLLQPMLVETLRLLRTTRMVFLLRRRMSMHYMVR
jgi:glycosyltransferase involved in cell wall biosynthesis